MLDLFAGTGQLGIEALSRGACRCDFVDQALAAVKVVRENLRSCGLERQAAVYQKDFLDFLKGTQEKYDLVFLDPPYASGDLERALEYIAEIDIVSRNGIIICESPADASLPALAWPLEKGRDYRYGRLS